MGEVEQIKSFLAGRPFAVVGASSNRAKYGNKVLRNYMQRNLTVFPINRTSHEIEGLHAYPTLADLPHLVDGVSIITPPKETEAVIVQAITLGVRHFWLQPGAESKAAVHYALTAGANVIHSGPCLLVVLGFKER